ncbi:hypothetical protein SB6095_02196 [Klebsiella quasivariicola]|uniref:Uncharacterized protein n=1 Tax=Klebsiella quasivariicola TaxID=2026240 RepID=A0A5E5TCW5_9ENTR|nr:Uncharacterised protein [Klebsiella quasivariicola]SXD80596.1 Uncharacterised protein [Klebsiella variicola]SLY37039.1 Uncharacterised protein [Klebsiella quasivariicola]SXD45524.1 Uncharacterised protein [Klebsiella quasivariicola]SXD92916.1 Uncharacterised protein [Klebsiella quasivariicola]
MHHVAYFTWQHYVIIAIVFDFNIFQIVVDLCHL